MTENITHDDMRADAERVVAGQPASQIMLALHVLALLAENERLRGDAPGTSGGWLDALFALAEAECGHQPHSAKHALTTVQEWVRQAKEENERLRAALQPFAQGHLYVDEEFSHLDDRDARVLNHYDPDRSPKVGDCRRAAELLAATAPNRTEG